METSSHPGLSSLNQVRRFCETHSFIPLSITLSYIFMSSLYILYSDRLLYLLFETRTKITQWQTIKGWLFVLLTGLLLYLVLKIYVHRNEQAEEELKNSKDEYRDLYVSEKKARKEAEILREITDILNKNLDSDHFLPFILEKVQDVIPYHCASIQLIAEDKLIIQAVRGISDPHSLIGQQVAIENNTLVQPLMTDQNLLINNQIEEEEDWISFTPELDQVRSWMGAALRIQDRVLGILTVDSFEPNFFHLDDGKLLSAIANQAAIALHNAQLIQSVQSHAKELELRVEQRTQDLQKMVDLMAGREVRMAELKKVIQKLRAQITEADLEPIAGDPLTSNAGSDPEPTSQGDRFA
jgi:Ca2+/Na+ antiporter